MKLAHKLIAGYVVIAVITAGTGLVGMLAAGRLKVSYENLALGGVPIHKALGRLKFAGLRIVASTAEVVVLMDAKVHPMPINEFTGKPEGSGVLLEELKLIDEAKSLFYKAIGEYSTVVTIYDPGAEKYIKDIEQLAAELLESSFSLLVAKKTATAGEELQTAKARFETAERAYLTYINDVIAAKESVLDETLQSNISFYDNAFTLIILLGSISLVAAFAFGIFQAKGIADNLTRLTRKAELVGHGELGQILELKSNDELAELAGTFNKMSAELKQSSAEKEKAQEDLQRYAVQLENNAKELQEIVFVASHDLQEPMRKIMTFSERLRHDLENGVSDDAEEFLARMNAAAGKMRILLDDLLQYSKLINSDLVIAQCNLKIIVEQAIELLQDRLDESNAEITLGAFPAKIACDEKLLQEFFYHLFDNSLKFTRLGVSPVITVTGEEVDEFHEITVEDNGRGFDEKYADRIFNIFEKLHGEERFNGNGTGLALCRKIIEKHGGRIIAQGRKGAGAKFVVRIPKHPVSDPI